MTDKTSMYHQTQEEQKINLNIIIICAAEANTRILRDKMNFFFAKLEELNFFLESTITI